jgi:hypothetical protein
MIEFKRYLMPDKTEGLTVRAAVEKLRGKGKEAAGVEPNYLHGWRGFTARRATWGPHEEFNEWLK